MTLDEARAALGRAVLYRSRGGEVEEHGLISSVGNRLVFVRYGISGAAVGTEPEDLTPLVAP